MVENRCINNTRRPFLARVSIRSMLPLFFVLQAVHPALSEEEPFGGENPQEAELAQELFNPIADLITIPVQIDYDQDIGPSDDGDRVTMNIQPVVPFSLNTDWNLITRTILPVYRQDDVYPGKGSQEGIGDISLSVFASPVAPSDSGLVWGVGGVLVMPTASDDLLGTEKWSAGPTGVVLKEIGPWSVGMLGGHAWSFAGEGDREDVNSTQLYPWLSYTWPTATAVGLQSDATYDWESEDWHIPLDVGVSQLFDLGGNYLNVFLTVGYWVDAPDFAAEGWRYRIQFNYVMLK